MVTLKRTVTIDKENQPPSKVARTMKTTTVTRYVRAKKPNLYESQSFVHPGSTSMSNFLCNSFMNVNEYDSNLHYIKWKAIKSGTNTSAPMRIVIYAPKVPTTDLNVQTTGPIDPQTFRVFYDIVTSPSAKGLNIQQGITKLKSMLSESNTAQITKGTLKMGVFCTDDVTVGFTLAHTAKI